VYSTPPLSFPIAFPITGWRDSSNGHIPASPVYYGAHFAMDAVAIREEIEKILHSRTFANKGQLRKLLAVLHQNMDAQVILRPDQVIKELWPAEIRTKRSADVATEMNRLRHALKSYYEEEGAEDPVVIVLPNRAVGTGNEAPERQWIAAKLRGQKHDLAEDRPLDLQVIHRRKRKTVAAVAALLVVGIAAYVAVRVFAVHPRPQFGRLDGTVLRIMDAEGKELWSKNFPEGFGPDWHYPKGADGHIWFEDLEGRGHISVLFSYSPGGGNTTAIRSSVLICYSDRGREKWRWTPGRELPELNGSRATFLTSAVGVLKATGNRPARIVVSSQYWPWWANQIALLDSSGKTVSEYWHSGALTYTTLADLDGDGRQEIIAAGVSEYDHQATLVVLDSDRVFGASTEVRPEFQIHGMGVAQEKLRLLFPRSDLNRALYQFNLAQDPTVEHGSLRLTVAECITPLGCPIWYEFDKNFRLIAAYAGGDEFRSTHNRFYQTGKNAHTLSAEEQAAFLRVRCLVGCKSEFVPVGNLVP